MNIIILDDYQDAVRKLRCAAQLEPYHAKVFTNTVKGIGQLFPGPSKTTRAYTLREAGIVAAAAEAGFRPVRRSLNKALFYFSRLIAFERA